MSGPDNPPGHEECPRPHWDGIQYVCGAHTPPVPVPFTRTASGVVPAAPANAPRPSHVHPSAAAGVGKEVGRLRELVEHQREQMSQLGDQNAKLRDSNARLEELLADTLVGSATTPTKKKASKKAAKKKAAKKKAAKKKAAKKKAAKKKAAKKKRGR